MKKIFHNMIANKLMLGLLGLVLSVFVASVITTEGSQVLAAETYNDDTYKDFLVVDYTKEVAKTIIGQKLPNQPEKSGCEDWLFAGWYSDEVCTTPIRTVDEATDTCYAKFVPTDVLSVKCQPSKNLSEIVKAKDGTTNLRFVTSVDTDQYLNVGFDISRTGGAGYKPYALEATKEAYKRIVANATTDIYKYSPKVIDTKSEAFVTCTIKNIPYKYFEDTLFMAKPYWTTLDGMKVYGVTRYVKVSDAYNSVVNIPVQVTPASQGTYTSDKFAVTKAGASIDSTINVYYNANENYAAVAVSGQTGLDSATQYAVTHNGTTTTYIQRNLATEYTGSNADTSWYNIDTTAKEFVITTNADMYGFAQVVNNGITFEDVKVYLVSDVALNVGLAKETGWSTTDENGVAIDGATEYIWTPIGYNDSNIFRGIFDGQNHKISGVNGVQEEGADTVTYMGLFGIFKSATIKNIQLTNSYFASTGNASGSIVGRGEGNLEAVYSEAILNCTTGVAGGIVGLYQTGNTSTYQKCWFAGKIVTKKLPTGGIVGKVSQGTLNVKNCLYTGNIRIDETITNNDTSVGIGGIVGYLYRRGTSYTVTLNIDRCLNDGTILLGSNEDGSAAALGRFAARIVGHNRETSTGTLNVTNTYYTKRGLKGDFAWYYDGSKSVRNSTDGVTMLDRANITVSDSISEENVKATLGGLDFNNIWTIGEDGTPALKFYVESIDPELIATAWYYKDGVIRTRADLLGLSALSQTQSIDKNITLAADIDLNPGWTASETSGRPDIVWSPVGNEQYPFTGTFNANGHIISGIYIDDAIEYMGFFGVTGDSSEIKNLRIENSYFNQQATEGNGYVGSVAGELRGSMTNVYSNAIVKSNYEQIAGMVARLNANTSPVNITDCWFDGTVIGGTSGRYLGGIVSMIVDGTCNFENVLFTGVIDSDYRGSEQVTIGGIVADGMSETEKIAFESIISAGKIIGNHNHRAVHAIFGNVRTGILNNGTTSAIAHLPEVALSNVFASRTCYPTAYSHASATTGILIDENSEKVAITSQVTVTGQVMFTTGDDRLLGYIPQTIHLTDTDTDVTSVLGFYENGDWSLRKDGVPIPTALTDLVDTEISDVDYLSETDEKYQSIEGYLTKQIRLDWFGGSIDDLVAYGAGNYLTSYTNIDKTKYTDYLTKISANNRKFKEYTNTSTDAMELDGVYSAVYKREDIEWVLNITYVEKISTIYISVNTDLNSISSHLKPVTTSGTAPISFSMLEMQNSEKLGNSFVFQLPDGHFIVNDGGKRDDATYLLNYLKALAGTSNGEQNPVYIDAWIVTHYHSDHCGAMANLTADGKVFIEAVYACEPSMYGLTAEENVYGNVNAALKGITKFTKRDGTRPDFYQLHMGQRFYFNGITMDVIDTQEQNLEGKLTNKPSADKFNSTSTSCIYTFEDANDTTQRVIIGGDANNANMTYIMGAFGDGQGKSNTLSDINVYVAFHHGLNTTCTRVSGDYKVDGEGYRYRRIGTTDWADFLLNNITGGQFDIVLFPNTIVESASPRVDANGEKWYLTSTGLKDFSYNIGDMNQYFIDNTVEKRHYTYGTGDSTGESHGTVMITFDGNNQSTLYVQGSFTEAIE